MAREVAFAYDRNSEHEHRRRAVEEYELFVSWLCQTNRRNVYQEFHDHILHLQSSSITLHSSLMMLPMQHEHRHRAVEEYELFVSWLCQTNRRNVYQEFHEHILRLRDEDQYAHMPVHFPGVLGTKRS